MIKQAEKEYDPAALERRIRDFWSRTKAYEKMRRSRSRGKEFYFVDGPPYTSGTIHMGQALNKTIKDMVLRWRRMNNFNVRDQPGYDMHGLPIEVQVEKTLGITNKKEIEELGIERFVNTCREFGLDLLKKMQDQFILVWTTTPWTLPANLCVAVNPKFKYAKVRVTRAGKVEYLWLVEENVRAVMAAAKMEQYETAEVKSGTDLEGWRYTHPLSGKVPYQRTLQEPWVHRVALSDTVTAESTGCVHTAPGHGPEDFDLGQKLGLPAFSPVNERGVFTDEAGGYGRRTTPEGTSEIMEDLAAFRLLFAQGGITHRYGHCWRCKTPILFRATKQWFLKVTDLKAK